MIFTSIGILKFWKEGLIGLLLIGCLILTNIIRMQNVRLDNYEDKVENIKVQHRHIVQRLENEIEFVNKQAKYAQEQYDKLQKQHEQKVSSLNEQIRKQRNEYETNYNKLVSTNDRLHDQIRISNDRLSNLSHKASIDYSKRATEILAECSGRYIELAKAATNLQLDRNVLEDSYPTKEDK